jgi:membrane dipeptidase
MIDAAGEDHVGLGLHFCEYLYTPQEYPPVAGLEDASKAARIIHALRRARMTEDQIEKIAFRNFLRVFRDATS